MLGTRLVHKMKLKAAETKTILYATVSILATYVNRVPSGASVLEAGKLLCRYFDTLQEYGREFSAHIIQERFIAPSAMYVYNDSCALVPSCAHLCPHAVLLHAILCTCGSKKIYTYIYILCVQVHRLDS